MGLIEKIEHAITAKNNIRVAINDKGATVLAGEILSEYATAISSIPTGGGSGTTKDPLIKRMSEILQHTTYIKVHSDTELANTLDLTCLSIEDSNGGLSTVARDGPLDFTLSCSALEIDDTIKVQALPALYANKNGSSNTLTFRCSKHLIDELYGRPEGLTDVMHTTSYVDSGTYSIPVTVTNWATVASSMTVTADGVLKIGNVTVSLNARDESLRQLSYAYYVLKDDSDVIKVRWRGLASYSNYSTEYIWEAYFAYGAIVLHLINQPSSSFNGKFTVATPSGTLSYSISADSPFVTFYCNNLSYREYTMANEKLDSSKVLPKVPSTFTLDELIDAGRTYMVSKAYAVNSDSGTYSIPIIPWVYKGTTFTSCTISGDSWITLSGYSYLIQVNRRDAKIWSAFMQSTSVDFDGLLVDTTKIRWDGYAKYNASRDQVWDVYLFANGDAMINLIKQSAEYWNGTFNFCGASYTISTDTPFVSFYRQNVAGTSWKVVQGIYDISLSSNLI